MTVSTPPPTKQALDFADTLQNQIKKVSQRFPRISENWLDRLQWCRKTLGQFEISRPKRAPLGFIGRLSHTLFGTVTEAELSQYRNLLLDTNRSLNATIHRSNLLMSAVKSNRRNINRNTDHLARVQRYLNSLHTTLEKNFQITTDTVHLLSLKVKIEHALVSLEQSIHRITSFYDHRRRQRNSLYHHLLTEELLSPDQLQEVLSQARVKRFTTMPPTWYYENCKVSPVWSTLEEVTFKVHLPLHDGKSYISYHLHSYPFPIKPDFTTSLQVKSEIAYSSTTGLLFEPILCRGGSNKICRGGPLFDAAKFKCERALVSRNAAATGQCKVKITPTNETLISEQVPGIYIISTPAITPKLHCASLGERNIRLTPGVYIVSFNYSCTLRGVDWTLPGLKQFITPYHITNQVAPLSLRSIFTPLSTTHLEQLSQVPHWTKIEKLPSITLAPLSPPASYLSLPHLETLTWINSSSIVVITLIIVIAFICVKVCRKYKPIPRLWKRKVPSAPEVMELTNKDTPNSEESTPTIRLPMYPDLSRDIGS